MKRILLAAVAVVLGIVIVVFLRPERDRDAAGSGAGPTAAAPDGAATPVASASGRRPLGLPPVAPDVGDAGDDKGRSLTPAQKRAMHRLIQTYQQARRVVEEVESTEALAKELETERFKTDREGIQGAINSRIEDIQRCYEAWLGLNPELSGRIVTHFAIDGKEEESEEGRVVDVNVREGGLGNKFLEGCVLSVLSELQFERPGERIEVNYPFIFKTAPTEEEE